MDDLFSITFTRPGETKTGRYYSTFDINYRGQFRGTCGDSLLGTILLTV